MIYLIDDKKSRQSDYGWNSDALEKHASYIKAIYAYDEILKADISKQIFYEGNIILFHESFFDSSINKQHTKDLVVIREKLERFADQNTSFKVCYFSGSKSARNISKANNVAHLPVSILYQNLSVFIEEIENGNSDLRFLLFGKNYSIEEELLERLMYANNNIDELDFTTNSSCFIAQAESNEIETVFLNADYETFYSSENELVTDNYLNTKIIDWFTDKEYDNIFIPLSFGSILSDFNGLRLALHIRCTNTPNRLKNIFLYTFIDDKTMLYKNDYFDVLKTKNIQLIDYKKSAFKEVVDKKIKALTIQELSFEISKIHLNIPNNFYDNHSVSNIWGMYRLLEMEGVNPNEINSLNNLEFLNNIYIKWLLTKNPVNKNTIEESQVDTIRLTSKLRGIKTIGKIDLSKLNK
ncbi:hypothetical protein [Olleya sp.]|jgi:hypothetical protein|uniref:hypothetical protein n=1 Tax=Olleya sp. TaxID=1906788 RepID=UPI0032D96D9B